MPTSLDVNMILTVGVTILAVISIGAFAAIYIQRSRRRERYKAIIEKRRKDLFEATKRGDSIKRKEQSLSARDSMASFFKVQELAGEMGEKVRDKMLQAGIRSPSAPFKFMLAQAILPLLVCAWLMFVLSNIEADLSPALQILILFGGAFAGFKLPDLLIKNQIIKRQQEINLAFPDSLDMMLICVQGGIGLEQTVDRVANEMMNQSPVLAEELGILSAEMAMLNDRKGALKDFAKRVGSGAGKSFATSLIQAEQYGTSLSTALRVMSDELRDIRMSKAEEKAASLPPKLTVPMILFFLPALFIVILGPAGIKASAAGMM